MSNFRSMVVGVAAAAATFALLASIPQVSSQRASQKLPSGIVARVADVTITAEQILERIYEVEKTLPMADQRLRRAYTYYMYLEILRAEAKRLGVVVTPEDRSRITLEQITAAKEELRRRHAGQVTWEKYLEELGYTADDFEAMVYERSEQILLKRRLVWHWEYSCPSISYLQFVSRTRTAATLVRDRFVAEAQAILNANPAAAEPVPVESVMWPKGTLIANGELKDAFWNTTRIRTEAQSSIVNEAWAEAPLVESVHDVLFKQLAPGQFSEVIEVNPEMFVVVFLDRKSPGTTLTFSETKELLDQRPDPSEVQYERWIRAVLRGGRYDVEFRIPGAPEPKVLEPKEEGAEGEKPATGEKSTSGETPATGEKSSEGDKPSDAAKPKD